MSNMSASIIRELVASLFKVKATSIVLSSILHENFYMEENNAQGNLFSLNETIKVSAFNPIKGLWEIEGNVNASSQNANGALNSEYCVSFQDCAEQGADALFFVVEHSKSGWQQGKEDWNESSITLYKSPDFQEFFKGVEEKDLIRWEQWIKS